MNITEYQELSGINVASKDVDRVTATISKTQKILEGMLGYSLDTRDTNEYDEIGKTITECPCDINLDNLSAPDSVEFAYRLFTYREDDKYLSIDPATVIYAVKLVKDGVTVKTLDSDDYRAHFKNGLIKFIERRKLWCDVECEFVQLAVDAEWAFEEVPDDLLYIWSDMITYYSDLNKDIKSQVLGTHSYTKFDNREPENKSENLSIIKKYAGPNGSLNRTVTV
jgi:hypothetical protein